MIVRAITEFNHSEFQVTRVGIREIPPSGTNFEVLASVGLDTESLKTLFERNEMTK